MSQSFTVNFDYRNIYIRTKVAWYILGRPSALYRDYFTPFWTQVYVLHLAIAGALREARITYEEFLENLHRLSSRMSPVVSVKTILGHKLSQDDVEQDDVVCLCYITLLTCSCSFRLQRAFLASAIYPLIEDCGLSLKRSPLLKHFTTNVFAPVAFSTAQRNTPRASTSRQKSLSRAPEQAKATVITPIVGQIAEQLFNNPFRVVGEPQEAHDVAEEIADVKEHNENPTSIIWGMPAANNHNYYISVKIDGVEYQASAPILEV